MWLIALRKKILEHLVYECLVAPMALEAPTSVAQTKGCPGDTEGKGNPGPWEEAEEGLSELAHGHRQTR